MYSILNGKLILEKDAVIPITDKAYFFNFCVYSSLKVIQGEIFYGEYHVERLLDSAKMIDLYCDFSKAEILDWLNLLIQKNKTQDALLRLNMLGDIEENKNARIYITQITGLTYYPKQVYRDGIRVITYPGERLIPQAKTKDLLLGFLAFRKAKQMGANEALLIDHDGNIREGTQTNFWAIRGNELITAARDKIVEGVTRKIIFEAICDYNKNKLKSEEAINLCEGDIAFRDLDKYDEFFITSTTRNIMPIAQIDEMEKIKKFPITKKIQKIFKNYLKK